MSDLPGWELPLRIRVDQQSKEQARRELDEVTRLVEQAEQRMGGGGAGTPGASSRFRAGDFAGRPPPGGWGDTGGVGAPPPGGWQDRGVLPPNLPPRGFAAPRVTPSYWQGDTSIGGASAFRAAPSYAVGNTVGGASGAEGLAARSNALAAAEARKLAAASKDAAGSVQQLGLRTAWVLRSATSGGPFGLAGGALGAGAGLLAGNPSFGALAGNWLGQSTRSGVQNLAGVVAMGDPGAAYQFQRAGADFQGVLGRGLSPALNFFTGKLRQAGDALASNEGTVRKFGSAITWTADFLLGITGINRLLETGKPGSAAGAAVSAMAGHVFSSPDEIFLAAARQSILQTDERPAESSSATGASLRAEFNAAKKFENVPGLNVIAASQVATGGEVAKGLWHGLDQTLGRALYWLGRAATFGVDPDDKSPDPWRIQPQSPPGGWTPSNPPPGDMNAPRRQRGGLDQGTMNGRHYDMLDQLWIDALDAKVLT